MEERLDLYGLLGLKHERWTATDKQIKDGEDTSLSLLLRRILGGFVQSLTREARSQGNGPFKILSSPQFEEAATHLA